MKIRAVILEKLYEVSLRPYRHFKKKRAWELGIKDLLDYPEESLGFEVGCFLVENQFTIQDKLENHDVFHILTNTGISVPEEIGMQFYLFGNGKRSFYLFSVIVLGSLFYPEKIKFFTFQYYKGKRSLPFHQIDFYKLLDQPLERIKSTFLIQ